MIQFYKMHIGLIKYILKELSKQKSLLEIIIFFKKIIKAYLKELLRQYKNLFLIFDSTYKEQKKKYEGYNKIKKELNQALKLLQYVDKKMQQQGIPNWKRKQFWRDFFKHGEVRKDLFENLLKEINQIGGQ